LPALAIPQPPGVDTLALGLHKTLAYLQRANARDTTRHGHTIPTLEVSLAPVELLERRASPDWWFSGIHSETGA